MSTALGVWQWAASGDSAVRHLIASVDDYGVWFGCGESANPPAVGLGDFTSVPCVECERWLTTFRVDVVLVDGRAHFDPAWLK